MTKANDRANAERKRLEKNTAAKIRRLQKKGVATTNIDPRKPIDPSDTRAVKRYNQALRDFNSRENRIMAGYSGQAVSGKLWKEYQEIERRWNEEHARYWSQYMDRPLYSGGVEQAMSAELYQRMRGTYGSANPAYQRKAKISNIKGDKDLKARIAKMQVELAPDYRERRAEAFAMNILDKMSILGDSQLSKMIGNLTIKEAEALQRQTLFQDTFFSTLTTNYGGDLEVDVDLLELERRIESMKDDIRIIKGEDDGETIRDIAIRKGKVKRKTSRK